jgi:anti-sigma-K factor RskA
MLLFTAQTERRAKKMTAATVKIDGKQIECWVISKDPDPSASLWVIEQADPDNDHFVSRDQIIRTYDKQR